VCQASRLLHLAAALAVGWSVWMLAQGAPA
jgi:hypothetical protein